MTAVDFRGLHSHPHLHCPIHPESAHLSCSDCLTGCWSRWVNVNDWNINHSIKGWRACQAGQLRWFELTVVGTKNDHVSAASQAPGRCKTDQSQAYPEHVETRDSRSGSYLYLFPSPWVSTSSESTRRADGFLWSKDRHSYMFSKRASMSSPAAKAVEWDAPQSPQCNEIQIFLL